MTRLVMMMILLYRRIVVVVEIEKNTSAKLKVPGLALGVAFTAVAQITVKRRLEGSWLLRRCLTGFLFHKIEMFN